MSVHCRKRALKQCNSRPQPPQRAFAALARSLVAAAFVASFTVQALAQMSGGGHADHHPGTAAPANPMTPSGTPPAGGPGTQPSMGSGAGGMGAAGGMGEMMKGGEMGEMMGRPRKEFYPSLMDMPTLSAEQRQSIEAQARARISKGTDEIQSAQDALRHANAAGDTASAEQAASRLRDGLDQVKSGTTTLRALAEGKPPQQIAQDWFKSQLNLATAAPAHGVGGPLGLSWFHLITMALVTAFGAAMLAIYLMRMRRANALVDRLASAIPVTVTPPAPVPLPAVPSAGSPPGALRVATASRPTTATAPSPASAPTAMGPAVAPGPAAKPSAGGLWKGKLRVSAIFRETPNVKTFRLRDPEGGPIPFTFVPGQFVTYSAEIDGKLVRRSYTIASSAAQTAYVETTIKREEPGIFSDYMHDKIVEGGLVDVMAPSGVFTFTGREADSVVLIGGGVGITPLMAAIRYLDDTCWPGVIFLVYGAQTTEQFIFRDELEFRQRRMHNLHVAATMARAAGTSWMGAEGHITKEFLTQSVPELTKRRVHLCGPPGMMEAMKKILAELGVPPDQVKTEAFGPARGAVPPPGVTMVTPAQTPAAQFAAIATPAPATGAAPVVGPATATVRFARSNKTAPLQPDKTVLETAESAGVPIDYSCRVGICGTCKVPLLEGEVTMEVEEGLPPEDKARGMILACQAKSVGNLVVEA
jgi:ferredoxin-NADP reductase